MARGPYHSGAGVKGAGGTAKGGPNGAGSGGKPSFQKFSNQGRGPKSINIPSGGSHFRGASAGKSTMTTTNSGGHTQGVSSKMKATSKSQTSSKGGRDVRSSGDKGYGC